MRRTGPLEGRESHAGARKSPMRLFDPVLPNEPNNRTFRKELLSPRTFMSLLAILAILDVRGWLRWWLVPVLAGLAVLGAWSRTRWPQGVDARAGLREGLAFLQRRAWAMVPLAVLVVVATWPVPDYTLHKGVVPAVLLLVASTVLLRPGFPLLLRRTAVIYVFCFFVFLALHIVRWEFFGW